MIPTCGSEYACTNAWSRVSRRASPRHDHMLDIRSKVIMSNSTTACCRCYLPNVGQFHRMVLAPR